jgi:hypothetical protein
MIDAFSTNGSSPPSASAHHPPTSPPRQNGVRNQQRSRRAELNCRASRSPLSRRRSR